MNSHSPQKQPCRMTSCSAESDMFLHSKILARGQWILHLRPCSKNNFHAWIKRNFWFMQLYKTCVCFTYLSRNTSVLNFRISMFSIPGHWLSVFKRSATTNQAFGNVCHSNPFADRGGGGGRQSCHGTTQNLLRDGQHVFAPQGHECDHEWEGHQENSSKFDRSVVCDRNSVISKWNKFAPAAQQ